MSAQRRKNELEMAFLYGLSKQQSRKYNFVTFVAVILLAQLAKNIARASAKRLKNIARTTSKWRTSAVFAMSKVTMTLRDSLLLA